jgi:hypothetical protein
VVIPCSKPITFISRDKLTIVAPATEDFAIVGKTSHTSAVLNIEQILAQMGLSDAAPSLTPMEPSVDLSVGAPGVSLQVLFNDETAVYCKGVGFTMHATITHPEIAFHVSSFSQFMQELCSTHLKALTRVFKHLSGVRHHQLVLGGVNLLFARCSEANWTSDLDRRSISGYAFYLWNSLVD